MINVLVFCIRLFLDISETYPTSDIYPPLPTPCPCILYQIVCRYFRNLPNLRCLPPPPQPLSFPFLMPHFQSHNRFFSLILILRLRICVCMYGIVKRKYPKLSLLALPLSCFLPYLYTFPPSPSLTLLSTLLLYFPS